MKKKLITLLMLIATSFTFAQLEVVGSIGMAKFDEKFNGQKVSEHKSTLSGKLGFVYWIPFSDARFSINPGISYGSLGSKIKISNQDTTITLAYISVPVDFVYRIKPKGNSPFISTGGYYGYLISAQTQSNDLNINDGDYSYKNSDFGVNIGGGYAFDNGLTLRLGYSKGLSNILNYPVGTNDSFIKNSNLSLSIGYTIFKKRI